MDGIEQKVQLIKERGYESRVCWHPVEGDGRSSVREEFSSPQMPAWHSQGKSGGFLALCSDLFAFRGGEWLASQEVEVPKVQKHILNVLAVAPIHPPNYMSILLALYYFPLCGYAYLAHLLIGSVSMFDFGIGCVGVKKKIKEYLGHFDLFVRIERAGRVRLNIKE